MPASFRELLNSTTLDINRWSDCTEFDCAVNGILSPVGGGTKKQKKTTKMLILNLYAAWLADPAMFITYQRAHSAYHVKSRYNALKIGSSATIASVDTLESRGYIEGKDGFFDRRKGRKYRSRIRATKKLIKLFSSCNIEPYMIDHDENDELIILKDSNKNLTEYEDNAQTYVMRTFLAGVNQSLARTRITLDISDDEMKALNARLRLHPTKTPIDFTRKRLRRIFNNSSFEEGGRFYHGWWQEIPSEYRQYININEKRTIEVDYSALILRMLYALEGHTVPTGDPYTITTLSRDLAKEVFIILLNAKDESSAYKAIRREHPKKIDKATWDKAVTEIKAKHAPIAKDFFSGIGLKLQEYDSRMAEIVMDIINQEGIVALPVHDSFIVRSSYEDELKKAMEFAATQVIEDFSAKLKAESSGITTTSNRSATLHDLLENMEKHSIYHKQIDTQRKHTNYLPYRPRIWVNTKWSVKPDDEGYISTIGINEAQRRVSINIIDYLNRSKSDNLTVKEIIEDLDISHGGSGLAEILTYTRNNIFDWTVENDVYKKWSKDHLVDPSKDSFSRLTVM